MTIDIKRLSEQHADRAQRAATWGKVRPRLPLLGDDWPEALTIEEIAFLHGLRDGRPDRVAEERFRDFLEYLAYHWEPGEPNGLPTFEASRRERPAVCGLGSRDDNAMPPTIAQRTLVRVQDAARLLADLDLGPCLRAWLAPYPPAEKLAPVQTSQAETHQEEAAIAVTATRKETQADRVEACLKECERRAFEQKKAFDCSNMPGQKAQFFELLRRFDASFRNLKDSTLQGYVKVARCKWSVGANANSDATEFYRELFPDAWRNEGRGVSGQGRRA